MTADGLGFLEAKRALAAVDGAPEATVFLGMSGTADPLLMYVQAEGALRGRDVTIQVPSFGTLPQALLEPTREGVEEVFLLCPWDLVPELDWRTGIGGTEVDYGAAMLAAERTLATCAERCAGSGLLYVDAPIAPLGSRRGEHNRLRASLVAVALAADADVLPEDVFSLSGYLAHGCPVAGQSLGRVGRRIAERAFGGRGAPHKVLVTDFDNTLWHGVLAEEGEGGVAHGAEGEGFQHFVYQTFLAQLKKDGALLAGVTRNAPDIVDPILASDDMVLGEGDFVAVVASYNAKSAQIADLAERLNLGLDSFVFVDDNEVEIEEVSRALPEVKAVHFTGRGDDLPAMLDRISELFARDEPVTEEDRLRTQLYRQRLEGTVPSDRAGADITDFLQGLEMKLKITDRSSGDRTRAVQLINKTNQFNLNGRRWTDEEVGDVLSRGGRLVCATLEDRTGSHGEILACLLTEDGVAASWVMSCRVFQRRVEYAFLLTLEQMGIAPRGLAYAETDRNLPLGTFLGSPAFEILDGQDTSFDAERFRAEHADALDLFEVVG